jgi:hypothetical protein
MRRHLSRESVSVMAFPAISPAQAVQLGVVAQAAGSAAASAFSDLFRSAAELLAPATQCESRAGSPNQTSVGSSDLSVLSGQIESLLSRIAERVRDIMAAGQRQIPPGGLTLAQDPGGNVAVVGEGEEGPALSPLLQQDDLLRSLFRALDARKLLFDSASSPGESGGPLQLRVDAAGARTVGA